MTNFSSRAQALREQLIQRRRDFHAHPELAFEEYRTAGIVADTLQHLGLEVQSGVGRTGVVGILEGAHEGPTVLIRADMDALPIIEETGLPFASTVSGKMHACGHDGHTAIALGVAQLLADERHNLVGRVKFVFQPAEEIGLGAKTMISDGALGDPRPDVSIGLHLWNSLPLGVIGAPDGPLMAGASVFSLTIHGKGGHAASPHLARDPVVCAAYLITQLQTIASRSVDPLESAVISVTMFHAGTADNIIPEVVEIKGTIRTFKTEVRELVMARMSTLVDLTCRAMDCEGKFTIVHETDPVINAPEVGARLRAAFSQIEGVERIDTSLTTMGAEDMGFFMQDVPGMYFFVGASDPTADTYYGHHHPRFNINEEALPLGVALLTAAAAAYVLPTDHA